MIALLLLPAFAAEPHDTATRAVAMEFRQDRVTVPAAEVDTHHARACDAGYTPSCERSWTSGDLRSAADALSSTCEAGDPVACTVVGWSLTQSTTGRFDPTPDADAAERALRLFRSSCAAGVERACVSEGVLLTRGAEGAEGLPKAQALFQTACQVGELAGCRRLGAMHHNGRGIGRDLEKARLYYGKACDADYALGCNGLALIDHLGVGAPRRPDAAEANYIKACDAGLTGACENLDKLYRNGVNPDEDPAAAMRVWASGCSRGVPAACANGGRLASDNRRLGEAANPMRARELFERGCELGDAFTCGLLGTHLLPSDAERGVSLLENACVTGIAPACADLADALWEGDYLKKDKKRARLLYTTACDGEYEPACERAR